MVTNGPSYFNLGGGSAATTKPARSRPPARRAALPAPFPAELLDVTPSVSLLARERFLVIECPHQGQQWRSAAAVLRTLAGEAASFTDRIDDDGYQAAARSSGDVDPNPRWDLEDLEHPELPSEAKVLILELTGSAGRARYDSLLGSPGSRRALTSTLERTGRYLVLLAASRNAPRATGACEGLPVLAVPFLSLWLKERYPSDHQRLAALLHDKLTQHDWESEEAVFDWLCQRPHDLSAEALIADLSGQCGEPKPIAAVRQALERCDEKDEVFLTAIFVAAYLPSLSPYEFSEVMTALLGQRTREDERASPRPSGGEPGMPPAPAQLSLAVEWAQTSRQVMARGDLVLQPSVSGAGSAVVFRAQRAPLALRRELDAAPFFLDAQLEHLRESGLLFHSHGAVRAAVIQLLVRVARQAPLRIGSDWLLDLIEKRRLNMGLRELAANASAEATEEVMPRAFAYAEDLLRQLANAASDSGAQRSAAVIGVLDALMQRAPAKARIGLELAYRLRHASGMSPWPWLRRALDDEAAPQASVRELALSQVKELIEDPAQGTSAVEILISWLPDAGSLAGCQVAAAEALALAVQHSFLPSPETPPLLDLLDKLESRADQGPAAELMRSLARITAHVPVEKLYLSLLPTVEDLSDQVAAAYARCTIAWREIEQRVLAAAPELASPSKARHLAACLAGWRLAHPARSALVARLAERVRADLGDQRRLAQQFIDLLIELLAASEGSMGTESTLAIAERRRLLGELRQRRQGLVELRGWLTRKPSLGESSTGEPAPQLAATTLPSTPSSPSASAG